MRLRSAVILAMVLCLPAAGWAAFTLSHQLLADGNTPPELRQFIPADPPRPAPAISVTDGAGNALTLADFRGRFVLVNLWATWCEPCIREMPSLDRLQGALGGADFAILLISQDRGGERVVAPFFEKLGLARLKTALDPQSTAGRAFAVRGLPTSIVIDARGRVVGRVEGAAEWDSGAMMAALKPFLEGGPGVLKGAAR